MADPRFVIKARIGMAALGGVASAVAGYGYLDELFVAGDSDSKIHDIVINAIDVTQIGSIVVFLVRPSSTNTTASGQTIQQQEMTSLFASIPIPAISTGKPLFRYSLSSDMSNPASSSLPFDLPSGWKIKIGTTVSNNRFHASCIAGDY